MMLLQAFLRDNGLKMIIRSHEGPDARIQRSNDDKMGSIDGGFSIDHDTPSRSRVVNGAHSVVGKDHNTAPQLATGGAATSGVGSRTSRGLLCL
jgi:serine/threonine-protein phosphatase 5